MKQDELEQLFIGSILRNPKGIALASNVGMDLRTEPAIASYQSALTLFNSRKPVNLQTVAMGAGWEKYTGWLSTAEDIGSGVNISWLAREIQARASKGRVKMVLQDAISHIEHRDVSETLESLKKLYSAEILGGSETGSIKEAMKEFEAQAEKYRIAGNIGISTGFTKWDEAMIAYEPGHLWAIGGFTSVGKTATALEFIGRIGASKGIAVFSMEMTKPQIISRMLSRLTGHSSKAILGGKINDSAVVAAKKHLGAMPLHIFRKTRSWTDISNACRVLKMQGQIDIAIWDYQQNIASDGKTTHDKMELISRSAQDLVQDLEMTGVMLSQISMQQNREDSGSPEFKGGGGLAECADVAIHLSRPKNSETDLLVEMRKNRHGPKIPILLEYQDHYTRLEERG